MDEFSYLSVLISIILGLGITRLITGLGRIIEARRHVRLYWPVVGWIGLLLIIHVQTWWAMFGLRGHRDWTFFAFLVVLAHPILLYLLAALVLPEIGSAPVDLRANYYEQSRWFFGISLLVIAVSLGRDLVLDGSLPDALNTGIQLCFFVLGSIAMFTRRPRFHEILIPINVALYSIYVGALFARLR
jgi:hypothetical protein